MTFGPTIPICVVQSSLRVWWKSRNSGPPNQSKTIFIDHDIAQGVDKLFPDDCGRLDNGRGALCFGDAVLCRQRKSPLKVFILLVTKQQELVDCRRDHEVLLFVDFVF